MNVQTYLFFDGRTEEALEFYRTAVGATDIKIMRNRESPEPHPPGSLPPGSENKVMHASFRVGDTVVMASDGHCQGNAKFAGFGLVITVTREADARRLFDALAQGGQVQMPLTKTFFSPQFGMLADKFGVGWMVMVDDGSRGA
jgi:PhnB protein